jgi:hypothetical protein
MQKKGIYTMRKIALLLALLMVFGALFVSCGDKKDKKSDSSEK